MCNFIRRERSEEPGPLTFSSDFFTHPMFPAPCHALDRALVLGEPRLVAIMLRSLARRSGAIEKFVRGGNNDGHRRARCQWMMPRSTVRHARMPH